MQKFYVHGVPPDSTSIGGQDAAIQRRIAIVFRRGLEKTQATDSGKASASLEPRLPISYQFGNKIEGLQEGSLYTRLELFNLNAHM